MEMEMIHKQFEVKTMDDNGKRQLIIKGSDATPDRDSDIIQPSGWLLDNYMKNPVFLWAHNPSIPPIGKAVDVQKNADGLMFTIEFPPEGTYKFADTIYELYKGGFMNASSVGFIGKEASPRTDEEAMKQPAYRRGRNFTKQELLELSAVPIPSNPSALVQARSFGVISAEEETVFNVFMKQFGVQTEPVVHANDDDEQRKQDEIKASELEAKLKKLEVRRKHVELLTKLYKIQGEIN